MLAVGSQLITPFYPHPPHVQWLAFRAWVRLHDLHENARHASLSGHGIMNPKGQGGAVGVVRKRHNARVIRPFVVERVVVPAVVRDDDQRKFDRAFQNERIVDAPSRPTVVLGREDIMSEGADRRGQFRRDVFVHVERGHASLAGVVLAEIPRNFIRMCGGISPRGIEVCAGEGRVVVGQ